MEVVLTILLGVLALLLYVVNENNQKNLELKRKLHEKELAEAEARRLAPMPYERKLPPMPYERKVAPSPPPPKVQIREVEKIREVVVVKPVYVPQPSPPPALPESERYCSVIFKKRGKRRYDYFLGDNYDVRVGDFVVVPVHDKWKNRNVIKVAKVVYISSPYETSFKANSTIIRKADYPKW